MDKIVRFNILGRVTTSWTYSMIIKEEDLFQNRLRQEIKGPDIKRAARQNSGTKSKQQQLLMGVVKRKSNDAVQVFSPFVR